ncbi:MAG: hypothetical protein VYD57_11385 [Pseudomonadota bacterium]|nr:hypothetical protein [Pseudomonadota bacterium]
MKRLRGVFFALAGTGLLSLVAAFFVAPGPFQSISMLSRDDRGEAAAKLGNSIFSQGEEGDAFLGKLADLNRSFGDPDAQARAIETVLAREPYNEAALRRAVDYYAHRQDTTALVTALRRLVEIEHDPDDVERLARTLRLWGDHDGERALLISNVSVALSPDLSLRQGEFLVREHRLDEAVTVLLRAVETNGTHRWPARRLLFDTFLDLGKVEAASEQAEVWVSAGLGEDRQAELVIRLAGRKETQAARSLAGAAHGRAKLPETLAWTLGNHGHVDLAREVAMSWSKGRERKDAIRAMRLYGRIAVSLNDLRPLYRDIQSLLASEAQAQREMAVDLASVLYGLKGYQAIAGIRHLLAREPLSSRPLFAASIARSESQTMAIRGFLKLVDVGTLNEDEALEWRDLAKVAFSPDEIATALRRAFRNDDLPPALLPVFREASRQAGFGDPLFDRTLRSGASVRS